MRIAILGFIISLIVAFPALGEEVTVHAVQDGVTAVAQSAQDTVQSLSREARDAGETVAEAAQEMTDTTRDAVDELATNETLVTLGGVMAGVVIGALVADALGGSGLVSLTVAGVGGFIGYVVATQE